MNKITETNNTIVDVDGNELQNVGTPFDSFRLPSAGETVGSAAQKLADSSGKAGRVLLLATILGLTACEKEDINSQNPTSEVKLTTEQQAFANLLAPDADGTPKSITVNIGDPNDPYYMPELFKIEMRLVSAKSGDYEITPWISRKVLEDVLNKAYKEYPDQYGPKANIAFVIKKPNGSEYSPTSTQGVVLIDDNNPLTFSPAISQLPEQFTMDIFKQFNPNASTTKSYTLNKDDELQLWIESKSVGKQFATVKLPIKPVEVLATKASNGN